MSVNFVPLYMFLFLFIGLFSGIPIAFILGLISIVFSFSLWGIGGVNLIISAAWGTMNNFTLVAIPLFIFMALILEKSDVVTDLYDTFYKWSGGLRGGLAVATIVVGAIIGAVSGVVAAGVMGLGVIALPQMIKYGYNRKLSMGSILAGGTLGQMIPPSLNMVVYGSVTGVSVGRLFAGGIGVGVTLAFFFIMYILIRAFFDKNVCPALPIDERASWGEKFEALKVVALPSLLIILVLGSILSGAATPTEGAAVGALGSLLFSIVTGRFKFPILKDVCVQTLKVSSMVAWIIVTAGAFSSVFAGVGGNRLIQEIAAMLPGGRWGVLALSIVFVALLGMFLENVAIIMLAAPILSPILESYGFNPLWWGLLFMTLMQVAYLTPPFGLSLFYLKGVTPPDVQIEEIYESSLPFIGIQFACLIAIILMPEIALFLPKLFFP